MGPAGGRKYCLVGEAEKNLLREAMQQTHMSARAYHWILKLARTIADLEGNDKIETAHITEAIQNRPRKQTYEKMFSMSTNKLEVSEACTRHNSLSRRNIST